MWQNIIKDILERLFNKYTKFSFIHIILAVLLGYLGFSENFIDKFIAHDLQKIDIFISNNKTYLIITSLIFLCLSFYYLFKKEYNTFFLNNLKKELEKIELELKILKIKKEKKDYE